MSVEPVREHLARLVGTDTTSDRSNLDLIDYVVESISPFADEVVTVPDGSGDKVALLVRFGPGVAGGVVLSAHTDCVPVTGQPWTGDPFELRERGDRLLGRGVTDMKGFIACCMAAAPEMAAANLNEPIWLALSYDEELGAAGSDQIVDALEWSGCSPRAVIVGEPTGLRIVNGHKGIWIGRIRIDGHAVHSSMPDQGVDALRAAVMVIDRIREEAERQRPMVDDRFDPPHTTMNIGRLTAGTAVNIVPSSAEILFEYRGVPGADGPELGESIFEFAADVLPTRFGTVPAGLQVSVEALAAAPALKPEIDGEAERIVRLATGDQSPAMTVPYATDGSAFQALGLSTVVCGPGSIEQAHQPDESIDRSQLAACARMLTSLVELCSSGRSLGRAAAVVGDIDGTG